MIEVRIQDAIQSLTVEEFEARVRAGRIHAETEVRFAPVTGEGWSRAGDLEFFHDLAVDPSRRTATRLEEMAPPIATAVLVGINIRVWWLGVTLDRGQLTSAALTDWLPPILLDGEVWRLITMGFAHIDPMHIVANLVWFTLAASQLERVLGRANMVGIYMFSVLVGSLASAFGSPISPSLGASGGVLGLVGALVVFGLRNPELLSRRQKQFFGWTMTPYAVFIVLSGLTSPNTDNLAHFFGLLGGMVFTFALSPSNPSRNQKVRRGSLAASLALMGAMALMGPRIYPLWDSTVAGERLLAAKGKVLPPRAKGEEPLVHYSVPAGWERFTSPVGTSGFRDPTNHPDRSAGFSVAHRESETLATPEERYDAVVESLKRALPTVTVPEAQPGVVAGVEGLYFKAAIADGITMEWFAATRGVFSIDVFWWTDDRRVERLAPLRDRLLDSITWREPPELEDARRAVRETPGPSAKRRLAMQLIRIGDAEEALELLHEVLEVTPDSTPAWLALLDLHRMLGKPAPHARALATAPSAETAIAVSESLTSEERFAEARGILDIAGGMWPSDKALRKARLREGLPGRRDRDTRLPWHLVYDVTGAPLPTHEREALAARPLTLEAALEADARIDRLRTRATTLALDSKRDRLATLSFLKYRYVPTDQEAAADKIRADLTKAAAGRAPSWMPPEIAAAAADPAFIASL
ncbi:MAG: rhomboid family intramembrane serine protease [Proteobacteria bacterium]|nr:rhomboid family intramembrane serine protease [Pseudomonadota bacterium]